LQEVYAKIKWDHYNFQPAITLQILDRFEKIKVFRNQNDEISLLTKFHGLCLCSHMQLWITRHGMTQTSAHQHYTHPKAGSQTGGLRGHFVRPAMLFRNFQMFNIYVAKCLETRCREIHEPKR